MLLRYYGIERTDLQFSKNEFTLHCQPHPWNSHPAGFMRRDDTDPVNRLRLFSDQLPSRATRLDLRRNLVEDNSQEQ